MIPDGPEADRLLRRVDPIGTVYRAGPTERSDELAPTACALFVMLALAGCAQGVTGRAQAPYAPYSPENNGNMHDSGGGGVEVEACSRPLKS
jgi:hypothetical protein